MRRRTYLVGIGGATTGGVAGIATAGATVQEDDDAEATTEDRLVDDFERGDLEPYRGDVEYFELIDLEEKEGLLLQKNGEGFRWIYSMPGDGLEHYPVRGDTIQFYINTATSSQSEGPHSQHHFHYGVQRDHDHDQGAQYYLASIVPDADTIALHRFDEDAGQDSTSMLELAAESDIEFYSGRWYRCVVEWGPEGETDPTHRFTVHEAFGEQETVGEVEAENDDILGEDGGIGFSADGNVGRERWDNIQLLP